MGKNNVNPNHYKVAGRDRQGEDILQERHRQKHAQSLARERFEPRLMAAAHAGPAPGALVPGPPPPGPSATSTAHDENRTTPTTLQKAPATRVAAPTAKKTTARKKTARKTTGAKRPAKGAAKPSAKRGAAKRGAKKASTARGTRTARTGAKNRSSRKAVKARR